MHTHGLSVEIFKSVYVCQTRGLCQRDRAARWFNLGWVVGDGVGQTIAAPNVAGARKLKAVIFYTINPLLYEKRPLCVFGSTYAVHLRLIRKPVVDFLLVIIELLFARCYG